jgi:hypothetical protein
MASDEGTAAFQVRRRPCWSSFVMLATPAGAVIRYGSGARRTLMTLAVKRTVHGSLLLLFFFLSLVSSSSFICQQVR